MLVNDDKFVVMGGDDFIYHANGASELKIALDEWDSVESEHMIMGVTLPREQAVKYGVLRTNNKQFLLSIDEKPSLNNIPKNPQVNTSRYLFSKTIWEFINKNVGNEHIHSEYYITNSISRAINNGSSIYVHKVIGQYLDGGTFSGLQSASTYIQNNPPK
jgi:UTP-glucose-1-phosphate uridylyltransferase